MGQRNLTFSSFTLAGAPFNGVGIEYKPKEYGFRFSYIYGQFQKPVKLDTLDKNAPPAAFSRKGYAAKVGYVDGKEFFDMIVMSLKDDLHSISSFDEQQVLPQENFVVGLNGKMMLAPKLSLDYEGALSALTKDLRAKELNLDSLDPRIAFTKAFYTARTSTQLHYATTGALSYREKSASFRFIYKRIEADYTSLGATYLPQDVQAFTLNPSWSMFKSKLNFNLNGGIEMDNLSRNKLSTTTRFAGSAIVNWQPSHYFGVDGTYSSFTFDQQPDRRRLDDSTRIKQINQNISITPRLTFRGKRVFHNIIFVFNQMQINNTSYTLTAPKTDGTVSMGHFIYSLSLLKIGMNINSGANLTYTDVGLVATRNFGSNMGISKTLFHKKLRVASNGTYSFIYKGLLLSGHSYTTTLSCSYSVTKHNSLSLSGSFVKFQPVNNTLASRDEERASIMYSYNF